MWSVITCLDGKNLEHSALCVLCLVNNPMWIVDTDVSTTTRQDSGNVVECCSGVVLPEDPKEDLEQNVRGREGRCRAFLQGLMYSFLV